MTQDMLVKLITTALTSLVLLPLSCLSSGCVGHGSRTVEVEFFGQRIVVRDTIPPDSEGKTEYVRTLDPNGWKFALGWLSPEDPEGPPAPEVETP